MNALGVLFRETSLGRFLIPGGLIFLIFGIAVLVVNINNQNYIKTEATVIDVSVEEEAHTDADGDRVEATYKVKFKYTVSGKEYEAELGGMSKHEKGEKIEIYYNPDDPSKVTQTKSLILPIVMIVAGLGMIIGGVISLKNALAKHKEMKEQEKEWVNNNG